MFTGTLPEEVKRVLYNLLLNKKQDVFVGCSDNFTADKLLSTMGLKVHSNDVSLYSKLISDILLNTRTEVSVKNEELKDIFSQWGESKYKDLIQVMFSLRLSKFADRKNDFKAQMYDSYMMCANDYFTRSVEKMERNEQFNFCVESFFYGDFVSHLNMNEDGIGICFPPTYKGGYEKMFKFIDDSFEYIHAEYNIFDPVGAVIVFKDLLDSGENIICNDVDIVELERYKIAKCSLSYNKKNLYLYSSVERSSKKYFIERNSSTLKSGYSVIDIDYKFSDSSNIKIEVCKAADVNYFKMFYMSNVVNYTNGGDFGIAFIADGRAFGFASFSKRLSNDEYLFIQSDFVVNSHIKRLSKLLIMMLKSNEVRMACNIALSHYYKGLKTSVYTSRPVSMKYRGVFNLEKREDGKKLMYSSEFSGENIKYIFEKWKKRTIQGI